MSRFFEHISLNHSQIFIFMQVHKKMYIHFALYANKNDGFLLQSSV